MDALSILRAARVILSSPEQWRQGVRRWGGDKTCCIGEAIESVSQVDKERVRAYRAFENAAAVPGDMNLCAWNDAPERTHAEVIVALNLAIATLRLC